MRIKVLVLDAEDPNSTWEEEIDVLLETRIVWIFQRLVHQLNNPRFRRPADFFYCGKQPLSLSTTVGELNLGDGSILLARFK